MEVSEGGGGSWLYINSSSNGIELLLAVEVRCYLLARR